jgi:hypothetical protein
MASCAMLSTAVPMRRAGGIERRFYRTINLIDGAQRHCLSGRRVHLVTSLC